MGMPEWRHPPDAATSAIAQAIGRTVRAGRRRRLWSQRVLAERVGVSQSAISRIEHGQMITATVTLYRIAEVLGGLTIGAGDGVAGTGVTQGRSPAGPSDRY
jgi:UDP-N-acetylglucosamine 1-carboxyvinyltransferase